MTLTPVRSSAPAVDRPLGEQVVEVQPGADQAVVGEAGQLGPVQLEPDPAADDPQALVVQPAGLGRGVDAHPDQLLDRARGQPVAADLLPRELGLLQQQHPYAVPGQVVRGRRATGTGADDDDVGVVFHRGHSRLLPHAREMLHKPDGTSL